MPGLSFPQLLALTVGGVLIYSAIKGKTPVEVFKTSLTSAKTVDNSPAPAPATGPLTKQAAEPSAVKFR